MKFSELVNYRNQLRDLSIKSMKMTAYLDLDKISYLAGSKNVLSNQTQDKLQNLRKQIEDNFEVFDQHLELIRLEVENIVTEQGKFYFQESAARYEASINNRDVQRPEYIKLDRHLRYKMPDEDFNFLKNRLSKYSNWQFPGAIIHPGHETFIDVMVANDPLYVVDDRHELLEPAITRFNELYQGRLCKYIVTETLLDEPLLGAMPNNQFGLILAYNYLNFRPFDVVKQYLKEIFDKLRPGGIGIITINDGDRAPGVMLVEQKWCYYTPLNLILDYCRSIGYIVEFQWTDGGSSTWIELIKPGNLESIRGGQTLATIVPKPIA